MNKLLLALSILSLFSQKAIAGGTDNDDLSDQEIILKTADHARASQFHCVSDRGTLFTDEGHLLYAAHCNSSGLIKLARAGQLNATFYGNAKVLDTVKITNGVYHTDPIPGTKNDLVIFKLERMPENVQRAQILTSNLDFLTCNLNTEFHAITYGPLGRIKRGRSDFKQIGGHKHGYRTKFFANDSEMIYTTLPQGNQIVSNQLYGVPVGGDSGGALFLKERNRWHLSGIMSGVSDKLQYMAGWQRVDSQVDWILRACRYLNQNPNSGNLMHFS